MAPFVGVGHFSRDPTVKKGKRGPLGYQVRQPMRHSRCDAHGSGLQRFLDVPRLCRPRFGAWDTKPFALVRLEGHGDQLCGYCMKQGFRV